MEERIKNIVNIILAALLIFGLFIFCLFKPATEISASERRKLKTMPEISTDTIFGKKGGTTFMDAFEEYAKDQFPLRELFRSINALSGRYLLGRAEINDLYISDGYIAKLEDSFHEQDFEWSVSRVQYILDKYIADNHVYMAVIPDKNYYLAPEAGYPCLDVDDFTMKLQERLSSVNFVNLSKLLSIDDYYRTDTHWKQESIRDVAEKLLTEMKRETGTLYKENTLSQDFYGVYYGQSALPAAAEHITYLTWDGMENIIVTCYDTGAAVEMDMYDLAAADGLDAYEVYLSGSKSLITIENPAAEDGELVVFRDSFGSSIAPLLSEGYRKITLVDIRYLSPAMVGRFVNFEGADVLFLYSTTVLNNSTGQFLQ